jgi:hypothetical protein
MGVKFWPSLRVFWSSKHDRLHLDLHPHPELQLFLARLRLELHPRLVVERVLRLE